MKFKKCFIICALSVCMLGAFSGCDGGSSSSSYDYYDKSGNGYNDEDVNWNGGGKGDKSKSWDQAVDDWNRANGY